MKKNTPIALAYNAVFLIFMIAPLAVVCLVAFTDKGYISMPVNGPSLRWFKAILDNPHFIDAFLLSLYLGLASATIAILIAVPAALATARYQFVGRQFIMAFFLSPLMVPHVVLGISFLRFLTSVGWYGTFIGLVLCHVIIIMPYALRMVIASVTGLDRSAEWAAVSLGASAFTTFRRITFPAILPGIAGGWVLAFITSFDELVMSVFVASPSTTTLPVRLYQHITETIDPLIASLSAVLIFMTVILVLILDYFYGLDKILTGKGN